jgi:putative transposase
VASGRHRHGQGLHGGRLGRAQLYRLREKGAKRSLVVEASGGPLGATLEGADVHDTNLLATTLESIVVDRPQLTAETSQHLCLDKGYDTPTGRETAAAC